MTIKLKTVQSLYCEKYEIYFVYFCYEETLTNVCDLYLSELLGVHLATVSNSDTDSEHLTSRAT